MNIQLGWRKNLPRDSGIATVAALKLGDRS
jgi:hypothetical protein